MPVTGCVDEISRARVLGWALDRDDPAAAVTLEVVVNGQPYARCRADRFRPGLAEHLGGSTNGHHEFALEFEPPLSVFRAQSIRVAVVSAPGGPLDGPARLLPAPRPGPEGPESNLTPLVVTSTGRSGSTWLMAELARHPGVVVADRYPYEIKLLAYYAAAFRALVANEDRARSTRPESMFVDADRYRIGHNPYHRPGLFSLARDRERMAALFGRTFPDRLATLFRRTIEDFYALLWSDKDALSRADKDALPRGNPQKTEARFFAEKGELDEAAREGARMLFGAVREVVLLRDPRDLLCSARAFWKLGTGEAAAMLATTLSRLEDIGREGAADVLFVRYEDLVERPAETRGRLYGFLGLEPPPAGERSAADAPTLAVAALPKLAGHATSRDPAASVGRWRTELTAGEVDLCETRFAGFLERFGYGRAAGPASTPPAPSPPAPSPPAPSPPAPSPPAPSRAKMPPDLSGGTGAGRLRLREGPSAVDGMDAVPAGLRRLLDVAVGPGLAGGRLAAGLLAGGLLAEGWSAIEGDFVWSSGVRARLHAAWGEDFASGPAGGGPAGDEKAGDKKAGGEKAGGEKAGGGKMGGGRARVLRLVAAPFLSAPRLNGQRVGVTVNGVGLGHVAWRGFGVVECDLDPVAPDGGRALDVVLDLPDAAAPHTLDPRHPDDRTLGVALRRVLVFGD